MSYPDSSARLGCGPETCSVSRSPAAGTVVASFSERLEPVLLSGDLVAAYELLSDLEGDELAEAKKGFAAKRRWFGQLWENLRTVREALGQPGPMAHDSYFIVGMCAVLLC